MSIKKLNAEKEVLLEQLELLEDISIQDTIKVIGCLNVKDVELFEKKFNNDMMQLLLR